MKRGSEIRKRIGIMRAAQHTLGRQALAPSSRMLFISKLMFSMNLLTFKASANAWKPQPGQWISMVFGSLEGPDILDVVQIGFMCFPK